MLFAAANDAKESGYLEYKEPVVTNAASTASTFLYIISLVAVFLCVLAAAYFVSKYLGSKLGMQGALNAKSILGILPLGQNKSLVFVEVLHSVLVLGVTDQNISLVKEISEADDIEKIKTDLQKKHKDTALFQSQKQSLEDFQQKIGPVLRKLPGASRGDVRK